MVESRAVRLADLFRDVAGARIVGDPDTGVSALSYRSSEAGPGHLFFCVRGSVHDGHDYAEDAVARGASALCVEHEIDVDVCQVVVPSVRLAMGPVSSLLYRHPSTRLATVGITGTNGKTTTAFLTAFLLEYAGRRAGLLGTVERRIGGVSFPTERTTPEAVDIQRDLAQMVDAGDQAAVLEVSSHALAQGRASGIVFTAVAFTNLTQDHLDYHRTIDAYFRAKARLFLDPGYARHRPLAVVNVGDPFGRIIGERLTPDRLLGFSVEYDPNSPGERWTTADLETMNVRLEHSGTRATLVVRGRAATLVARNEGRQVTGEERIVRELFTPLLGRFNLANVLASIGLGLGLGLELDGMLDAVRRFPGVPGRLERVEAGQDFDVLVDYAHTPDSVENVLRAAREVARRKVIAVLGCGGDRDRGKRPLMGRALEQAADLFVITSDNPRSERPEAIIQEILGGLQNPKRAIVEPDRRRAIERAVRLSAPGDMLLILGKGHEQGQEFADRTVLFDDREVAREALVTLHKGGG